MNFQQPLCRPFRAGFVIHYKPGATRDTRLATRDTRLATRDSPGLDSFAPGCHVLPPQGRVMQRRPETNNILGFDRIKRSINKKSPTENDYQHPCMVIRFPLGL